MSNHRDVTNMALTGAKAIFEKAGRIKQRNIVTSIDALFSGPQNGEEFRLKLIEYFQEMFEGWPLPDDNSLEGMIEFIREHEAVYFERMIIYPDASFQKGGKVS